MSVDDKDFDYKKGYFDMCFIVKDLTKKNEDLLRENYKLVWNLGGVSSYVLGDNSNSAHDKDFALPALEEARVLSNKYKDNLDLIRRAEKVISVAVSNSGRSIFDELLNDLRKAIWDKKDEMLKASKL